MFKYVYKTPNGFDDLVMFGENEFLTALLFKNSSDMSKAYPNCEEKIVSCFNDTIKWLDLYFGGKIPDFTPKYKVTEVSEFRRRVIDIVSKIPYGETVAYADIAAEIAREKGISKMSAQAVGGAVGANPVCIIVPCHRVIGKNGALTGYGGGIQNKIKLLEIEKTFDATLLYG